MNSAGKVEPGFQPPDSTSGIPSVKSTGPPRLLVEAVSRGLFFYLERNVPKTLVGLRALAVKLIAGRRQATYCSSTVANTRAARVWAGWPSVRVQHCRPWQCMR